MSITAKELADILGISPSTISLVFNGKPGISESTIKWVQDGAAQYGSARTKKDMTSELGKIITYVIYCRDGSIVSDTAFFSTVMQGIEYEARRLGYKLAIFTLYESADLAEQIETLRISGTSGLVLLATEMDKSKLESFSARGIPIVVIDNNLITNNIDTVYINNVQSAYCAVEYLISKGHINIGYLASSSRINNFSERELGLALALQTIGIGEINPKYRFDIGSTSDTAYRSMKKHIEAGCTFPTAFFADNDIIAAGSMRALKEAGYKMPGDISIIGFDDMPLCEFTEPPLTTMKVPKSTLGILSVGQLDKRIRNDNSCSLSIAVSSELVRRESVRQI
ncbi:MAG: substrate-binding domain-containing protein [Oscillospiraceae bacterium]|nr:substrate-binding domain-containing protein [Oscillospiraceae bacterium]